MKNKLISFLFILTILSIDVLFAQKAPIKFGSIDKADLEMTVYDLDSTAPAVILCDYGCWNTNDFMFKRILRVKILTAEGLHYANNIYPGFESTSVRGRTYNLENGEIIETKLKNESVFKERVTQDYFRLRIPMPDVKIGSVFEIEFTFYGIPYEWKFQREIPVRWSELYLPEAPRVDFRKNFYGYIPLAVTEDDHWIAKNMPAFKEEPYTNSIENYITKFEIDILTLGVYEFTTNWNAVARRLNDYDDFGGVINIALYLNSIASEIESKYTTDIDKLKAAYQTISDTMKWNKVESLFPTHTTLGLILKDGVGNSADINLILVNLLRKLKLEAYPLVMSTRSNGFLPPFYASLNKLNYVIAYAKIGETEYLLDATDKVAPIGLLPMRCLNGQARIINEDISTPVTIKTDKKDKSTEIYDLELNSDMMLKGSYSSSRQEYSAYNFRNKYISFNSREEFIEDIESKNPGISLNNYEILNLDSIYKPLQEKSEISLSNQVYEIENQIFINPMLNNQIKENPFKPDERKFPIDYAYCIENTILIKIKIPDGYEVDKLPTTLKMELPDKTGRISYQIANINNILNISYKFNINKEMFVWNEYSYVKEFYNQIIKKQAEPIVLKKI